MFDWDFGFWTEQDRGGGGGSAGTTPPPADPPPPPPGVAAEPPAPEETPPGQPGASPAPETPPAPGGQTPEAYWQQQAEQSAAYLAQTQQALLQQRLQQQGLSPEHAQIVIQAVSMAQAYRQMLLRLASSPAVRELAARDAVRPYAAYGVKPEDVLDAPNPDAMVYVAYKKAVENQQRSLTQRRDEGRDRVEDGGGGGGVDISKLSSAELFHLAFDKSGRAR